MQYEKRSDNNRTATAHPEASKDPLSFSNEVSDTSLESIIDNLPLGVHVIDASFKVIALNRFLEKYFSVKKKDIIGKDLFSEVSDLSPAEWKDVYSLVMKTGIPHRRQYYRHTIGSGPKRGLNVYQKIQIVPLYEEGAITGALTIIEDLTDEVFNESKAKAIIDTAMDGFLRTGYDGAILDANDAVCGLLGRSKAELLTMHIKDIEAAESPEEVKEHLRKVKEHGTDRFESVLKRRDGALIDCEVSVSCLVLGLDKEMYVSFIRDITEKKKLIRERQEEQRRFLHDMADSLPGVFFIFDSQGRLKDWNRRLEEVTGCSSVELGHSSILDLEPEDQHQLSAAVIKDIFDKGLGAVEGHLLARDGSRIPYFFTGHRSIVNGEPVVVGMGLDLTKQKEMEAELIKTQKLESLGILAGGIAHDFNNSLTAIIGNISLAKELAEKNTAVFKRLHEAEMASWKAQGLTKQLLTFAKGGEPLKQTINPAQLIQDAADFSIRGTGVKCRYHFPGDLRPIEADEGQLTQVINNLLINAVQSMPQGGVVDIAGANTRIGADEYAGLKPGNYVRIDVADQGCGIPDNIISRIFDPYFTTKQKGSGLGLATSHSIIRAHNGTISVNSKPGKGTTFTIILPASEHAPPAKETAKEAIVGGKGRILLMDDEQLILDVATEMLGFMGYMVDVSLNGADMLEKYKMAKEVKEPFDLVILDLTIPGGMGGKEAINKLLEVDPEAKAIVSSGYSSDPVMSDYDKYGFKGAVAKPYRITELGEEVARVLKIKERRSS